MRSLVLFACAAAGFLGGGALISVAALGGCLIFVSLAAGAWGLLTMDLPERGVRPGVRPSGPVFLDEYLRGKAAENW